MLDVSNINVTTSVLILILSLILLAYSSDLFTDGSIMVAKKTGISNFVIGVIIIGFGTSIPELSTSIYAASVGSSGISLGNVVGSNIANLALVLGSICIIGPIMINNEMELKKSLLSLIFVFVALFFIFHNLVVDRLDGIILLSLFILYIGYILKDSPNNSSDRFRGRTGRIVFNVFGGLVGVLLGSTFLVKSAINLAQFFGVSESIIGLTLVAGGTSLPELAVGLAAIRKGQSSMVLGNIMGSNIMNILLVLGLASMVMPLAVDVDIFISAGFLLFLSLMLVIFIKIKKELGRGAGFFLLSLYVLFLLIFTITSKLNISV
tara:strand:+ start:1863 stop:2825 length:963 start_codon:yes stop_codon:yes gene_type:complete